MILPEYDNDIEVEVLPMVHVGVLRPWEDEATAIRRFERHFAHREAERARKASLVPLSPAGNPHATNNPPARRPPG